MRSVIVEMMDALVHSLSSAAAHADTVAPAGEVWSAPVVGPCRAESTSAAQLAGLAAWFASYDDPTFWSDFGEEGLAVVFDLPLDSLRSLTASQRQALFGLFLELADDPVHPSLPELARLAGEPVAVRLARLLQLAAAGGAGRPDPVSQGNGSTQ